MDYQSIENEQLINNLREKKSWSGANGKIYANFRRDEY